MTEDISWLDATAQADLVRTGQVTADELLEGAIERIERLNPALNAVICRLYDKARAAIRDGLPDGPFRGVPFLIKDAVAHTAGDPYHLGMRALRDAYWTEPDDSWLVARYREAGFVICGKTNLPELATALTTEPLAYGPTHNPWDTSRSTGGSSGGAAAAVASGMVPVAHGNDMGGSIRFPAGWCGLVGLKPTRARTTLGPGFGEYWGPLTHEHVLTRSVRDSAGVLDAVAGPGTGDPYSAAPPARPWVDELGADPGSLRIGLRTLRREGAGESHPECVTAVQVAGDLLSSLGHHVEVVEVGALDDGGFAENLPATFGAVVAHEVDRLSARTGRQIRSDELEPANALFVEMGRTVTASQWLGALEGLQAWARRVSQFWAEGWDVLMTPTSPEPPVTLGEFVPTADNLFEVVVRMGSLATFTFPWNITGQPAVSLPLHWTPAGLPVGVQFIGGYGREDLLFRLASQLEAASPWAHRRPPVGA